MNQINLVGRISQDPQDIPSDGVKFSIAVDDYDFGTKTKGTLFFPCVAFGRVVPTIKNYAPKGKEVRVTGRLRKRSYTPSKGPHAGHEVDEWGVMVDDFELLAGNPAGGQAGSFPSNSDAGDPPSGW